MFYSVKMDMASIQFEELTILWAKKMSQIKVYSFSFKNMAIKSLKVWVCVCLIVIWQKPTQHCKASILLFRKRV